MPPHNSRPARLHVNQIINITHPPYTTRGYSRKFHPNQSEFRSKATKPTSKGRLQFICYRAPTSSPAKPTLLHRQRPNPLARSREYRIRHRRQNRWQRRLAQSRRRVVGLAPIHIDLRRLPHAHQRDGCGSSTAGSLPSTSVISCAMWLMPFHNPAIAPCSPPPPG